MSLTDFLDVLFNAVSAEKFLREQANAEFAAGNKNGTMLMAHKEAVANVIKAAKQLLNGAGNGC